MHALPDLIKICCINKKFHGENLKFEDVLFFGEGRSKQFRGSSQKKVAAEYIALLQPPTLLPGPGDSAGAGRMNLPPQKIRENHTGRKKN